MTTSVKIDNLKCGGCANSITTGLTKLEGIEHVSVDLESSTVEITHSAEITLDTLKSKLAKMGYPEFGTSNFGQMAKSYVSCAIGRIQEKTN
jgi:copper chaperone CopZ